MALLPEPISPDEEQEEPESPPISATPPRVPEKPPPLQEISPPSFHKIRFPLKIIAIFLFLVAFGAGLFFWLSQKPEPQIAAKVGSEKITLEEVKKTAQNCKLGEKEATEYLVDEKVLSQWAKDENITATSKEEEEEKILVGGAVYPNDPCIILKSKVNLLRKKLFQNIHAFREGKIIAINFGLYNPNTFLPNRLPTNTEERERLLREDRSYADKLTQSIYPDLKSKKITFDQALESVQKDPNIGLESKYGSSPQSGVFTAADYIQKSGLLVAEEIRSKINSLSQGEFSEPFVQKVPISFGENQNELVDARWIIVRVEKIGQGYGNDEETLIRKMREKYQGQILI